MAGTIVVACKLPHGLTVTFPTATDAQGSNVPHPTAQTVTFKGGNDQDAVGGYGMTENVDAEWFEAWKAMATDSVALKNHLIFASPNIDKARAQAREQRDVITGFEGAEPAKEGVEPTEEMKTELKKR